ncbi:hypothetical protein HYW76_05625 [Candidatus Pacearchaeota archaeon]|nr:hypothetical protein [Candidatus Pacearchaeota archaeon]
MIYKKSVKMIEWFIVGVLVLIVFTFLKFRHMQHRTLAVILIILLVFVAATGSKLVKDNNIDVKSFDGVVLAGKLYFSWMGQIFHNSKALVGSATKMNWEVNSSVVEHKIK